MQNRHLHLIAGLLLLGGVVSSPAAFAQGQLTYFPDISVALTPKAVQVHPPHLGLGSFVWPSNIQLEDRNGVLFLTQPPGSWVGRQPESKVLWSGDFRTGQRRFTVVNRNGEEQLRDDAGIIWSQKIKDLPLSLADGGTLTLEVTKETGSITITDENQRLLETVPSETLRLTASSDSEEFRKSIQYRFLSEPAAATTQVDVNAPGLIYVRYDTASGAWAGREAVHALSAAWRYGPGASRVQPGLDFWAAYFDKTGKRISTFHNGFRTFSQL